jgi:hypothetical protein
MWYLECVLFLNRMGGSHLALVVDCFVMGHSDRPPCRCQRSKRESGVLGDEPLPPDERGGGSVGDLWLELGAGWIRCT